jgi:hypothetical protein
MIEEIQVDDCQPPLRESEDSTTHVILGIPCTMLACVMPVQPTGLQKL